MIKKQLWLRIKFDHNPELIFTEDQTETFKQQYFQTLELYKTEFNTSPPEAIPGNTKFDKIFEKVPAHGCGGGD